MAQPAQTRLMTVEEFMQLPDPPNGERLELVDGIVCTMAPVGGSHAYRSNRIWRYLDDFVLSHGLGWAICEGSFLLYRGPDRTVTPDAAFIRGERLEGGQLPDTIIPVPPDLAVEVKSPTDRERNIHTKIGQYHAAGTGIVWVVRARERTVTIYRAGAAPVVRTEADTLDSADAGFAVDGFALPVAAIFA